MMVSRLTDSIENTPSDLTEEVEIARSFSPSNKTNEYVTVNGSTCSHTMEETHDDLIVSVITHSSNRRLVPPSSILHRTRTPPSSTPAPSSSCSSPYDCYMSGVSFTQEEQESSDNDSLSSSLSVDGYYYFGHREYLESTWAAVVSESDNMHIPMLAIATTAVMVHPLIFVAGAGVAAASFWAVGAFSDLMEYQYFSDNYFRQLFWNEKVPIEGEEQEAAAVVKLPAVDLRESFSSRTEETPMAAAPIASLQVPPLIRPSSEATNSRDFILKHFISLENEIVSQVQFPGLNAAQFFELFFSNDAPFTFKEFQKKRGDIDIVYGKWSTPTQAPASMHQNACGPLLDNMQERILQFKTLTKSYFGPAYASAEKTQRVTKKSKRLVILESCTRLEGIPFCDRFQVIERWVIETPKRRHVISSLLTVCFEVQFLKSCSFESQIRKKSSGTVTEIVTSWCDMAKEALERTAKAQQHVKPPDFDDNHHDEELDLDKTNKELEERHEEKLKRLEELKKGGGLESIEVQHSIQSFSHVVGEDKQKKSSRKGARPVTPKRSRSLRGIGNSVRQRFLRKASMPLNS